jgi:hypothetical protein
MVGTVCASEPLLAIPPVPILFPLQLQEHRMCVRSPTSQVEQRLVTTILIIDDEESIRTVFEVALEGAGYRVLTAGDGRYGLRLLCCAVSSKHYDWEGGV